MALFESMGAGLRHFARNLLRRDRDERESTGAGGKRTRATARS
jgi:hypothetical protein